MITYGLKAKWHYTKIGNSPNAYTDTHDARAESQFKRDTKYLRESNYVSRRRYSENDGKYFKLLQAN